MKKSTAQFIMEFASNELSYSEGGEGVEFRFRFDNQTELDRAARVLDEAYLECIHNSFKPMTKLDRNFERFCLCIGSAIDQGHCPYRKEGDFDKVRYLVIEFEHLEDARKCLNNLLPLLDLDLYTELWSKS